MPSPTHAAELERMLLRAAEECEAKAAWFGEGLPQTLRRAIEARGQATDRKPAEIAFIEVSAVSSEGRSSTPEALPSDPCRVIGLSASGIDALSSLIQSTCDNGIELARLICPFAVFDFTADGPCVREIRHGLTAADLQKELSVTLWAGPELKELGTH